MFREFTDPHNPKSWVIGAVLATAFVIFAFSSIVGVMWGIFWYMICFTIAAVCLHIADFNLFKWLSHGKARLIAAVVVAALYAVFLGGTGHIVRELILFVWSILVLMAGFHLGEIIWSHHDAIAQHVNDLAAQKADLGDTFRGARDAVVGSARRGFDEVRTEGDRIVHGPRSGNT